MDGGGLGLLSFDVQQHKGLSKKKTSHYLQITWKGCILASKVLLGATIACSTNQSIKSISSEINNQLN